MREVAEERAHLSPLPTWKLALPTSNRLVSRRQTSLRAIDLAIDRREGEIKGDFCRLRALVRACSARQSRLTANLLQQRDFRCKRKSRVKNVARVTGYSVVDRDEVKESTLESYKRCTRCFKRELPRSRAATDLCRQPIFAVANRIGRR